MATTVEIIIEATDRTAGALRSVTGNLQSVGRVALGGAAAGLTAVVGGLGAAATVGLGFNNSMEQIGAQLSAFLGGDGQAVADTLDMIRERAAATPFAFEDMARATAGLIPVANQSGIAIEDLIAQAEILAASNPAEGLEGAAFSLREALSGDFVSIIDRFNLPRQRINELRDEGVPAMEAISTAMQEMGLDASLVTNLSQTASGRLSTVKDRFMGIASDLTQPIFDRVSEGLGSFITVLEENSPAIDAFVQNATAQFDTFLTNVGTAFSSIAADPSLATVVEQLGMFGVPQEGQDSIMVVADGLATLWENLQPIIDPIAQFITDNVQLSDVLTALGIAIAAVVVPAIISMVVAMAPILLTFAAITAAVALVRTAWENNWGGIQEKTQAVIDFIRTFIQNGIDRIKAFWDENGDAIKAKAEEIWQGIQDFIDSAITFIQDIIETVMTGIQDFWAEHGDTILAKAEEIWQGIQDAVEYAIEHVKTIFEAFRLAFEGDWRGFGEKLREAWDATWEAIEIAIETAIDWIMTFFGSVDWGQLGMDLIMGIVNGVNNGVGALADAVMGAARNALEAAKGFLGISSPSKVFARAVGKPIMQGIEEGIKAGQPALHRTLGSASGGLVNGVNGRSGGSSGSGGRTINQTVNIYTSQVNGAADMAARQRFALGGI